MKVTKIYCQNWPHLISNALKCVGGWGSAPDPLGELTTPPPDPPIVRGNAPSALATLYFVSIFTSQFPFRDPPLWNSWIRHCYTAIIQLCKNFNCHDLLCASLHLSVRNTGGFSTESSAEKIAHNR